MVWLEIQKMINPPKDSPWFYQMKDIGWNYRASEVSCALGLNQFKRINKIIEKEILLLVYTKYLAHNKYVVYLNSVIKSLVRDGIFFSLILILKS